jgi:hypothetical protein
MRALIFMASFAFTSVLYSQADVIEQKQIGDEIVEKSLYSRFEGNITQIDSNTYRFDDDVLFIVNTPDELIRIFELGILYPKIIDEADNNSTSQIVSKTTDTSVVVIKYKGDKSFDSIFGSDSLTISDFRYINSSKKTLKIKKFQFLLFRNGLMNPTEYTIELLNNNATDSMDLESFIKGAKLIKINKGSLLI